MKWTEENNATLRLRWADGATGSAIGKELGFSRSAVLGQVNRLDLPKKGITRTSAAADTEQNKRTRTLPANIAVRVRRMTQPPAVPVAPLPVARVDDQAIPAEQRRTLLDLGPHDCRWPVGHPTDAAFFFCGSPTADVLTKRPYCAAHAKRARP